MAINIDANIIIMNENKHNDEVTDFINKQKILNEINKEVLVIPKIKLAIGELMMFIIQNQPNESYKKSSHFSNLELNKNNKKNISKYNNAIKIINIIKQSAPDINVTINSFDDLYTDRNNLAHFKSADAIKDEIKRLGQYFTAYDDLKDTLKLQFALISNIDKIIDIIGNNKGINIAVTPPVTIAPPPKKCIYKNYKKKLNITNRPIFMDYRAQRARGRATLYYKKN